MEHGARLVSFPLCLFRNLQPGQSGKLILFFSFVAPCKLDKRYEGSERDTGLICCQLLVQRLKTGQRTEYISCKTECKESEKATNPESGQI